MYVADYAADTIPVFNSAGVEIGGIAQTEVANPGMIAVGAPGVVYVGAEPFFGHGVAKVKVGPTYGVEEQMLLDGEGNAVAVEAHGDALIDEGSQISEYGPSGTRLGEYGSGNLAGSVGLAVDEETDHVYASSQANNDVSIFGLLVTLPKVITGPVSNLTTTSATLSGVVNPKGWR